MPGVRREVGFSEDIGSDEQEASKVIGFTSEPIPGFQYIMINRDVFFWWTDTGTPSVDHEVSKVGSKTP